MAGEDVFDLGEHLRDGLWRVESASLPDLRGVERVTIVGEPDALDAARLVVSTVDLAKPVTVGAGGGGGLVLCLSYDGEVEAAGEPLIAATTGGPLAAAARAAGQRVVPIPAGFTSASAIGYWVSIVADVLERAGVATGLRAQVEAAADAVEELAASLSRERLEPAQLAAVRSRLMGDSALQNALAAVLLVDVVVYHLGSVAACQ